MSLLFYTVQNHLKAVGKAIIFCYSQRKAKDTAEQSCFYTFTVYPTITVFFQSTWSQPSRSVHS